MKSAHGTRERIMAAHRYNPQKKADRETRAEQTTRGLSIQTRKRKGDLIITERATHKVTQDGWY